MNMQMIIKYILSIIIIIGGALNADAASRQFHQISSSNTMSSAKVNVIYRGADGMLWIGTPSGLNFYDGYKFRNLSLSDINGNIDNDNVTSIQEDAKANLWLKWGERYVYFNRKKESLCMNTSIHLSKSGELRECALYIDCNKNIWLADGLTLKQYNSDYKLIWKSNLKLSGDLGSVKMVDTGDHLYIVDNFGKLYSVNIRSNVIKAIAEPWTGVQAVYGLMIDKMGNLWLSSYYKNQILRKTITGNEWRLYELPEALSKSNAIRDMAVDENGEIWIATDHGGIYVYDPLFENITMHYTVDPLSPYSIPSNNTTTILFDNDANLWVGFDKHGIRLSLPSTRGIFSKYNPKIGDITAMLYDRKGNLWLGTDGAGLHYQSIGEDIRQLVGVPNISVMSLVEDRHGNIVVGTYDDGIYVVSDGGKVVHKSKTHGDLPNDRAWFINEDRLGNIWVASPISDPYVIAPNGETTIIKFDSGDQIHALTTYYDGADSIYMATGYGFCAVNIYNKHVGNAHLTNKRGTQKLKQHFIGEIFHDADGILWLGHLNGVTIWDQVTDSMYYLSKKDGLCDNIISVITEDRNRRIWIGTHNGLSIVNKTIGPKRSLSFNIRSYHEDEGLISDFITSHSCVINNNGDIAFGGIDGYTTISPSVFYEVRQKTPSVQFTGLKINNDNVVVDSVYNGFSINEAIGLINEIHLPYNTNNLTIEFASDDVARNNKIWYTYRIVGKSSNEDWILTQDNAVTFSHLAPGTYTLMVKVYGDIHGVSNDHVAKLKIIVDSPLYSRWWAFLSYIVIGGVILAWAILRQRRRNIEQIKIKAARYVDECKLRFFTNVSHDLRTQLTLILSPLQLLEKSVLPIDVKDKVLQIRRNTDILLGQINILLDFRKLDAGGEVLNPRTCDVVSFVKDIFLRYENYALTHNMGYSLNIPNDEHHITLDFDKTGKILNNLISNAFKYTHDGGSINVAIALDSSVNSLIITVSDTGKGIADKNKNKIFDRFYQAENSSGTIGSGIGLHIVKEYLKIMEGTIEVLDNSPRGTIFKVTLPYKLAELSCESSDSKQSSDKHTILFVDDNADMRDVLHKGLSEYYNIVLAVDGKDALSKLQDNNIEVVVSDVMMPVMNGNELCRTIKQDISTSHIPVILLTARTSDAHHLEGLTYGADDYLIKPFNFDILRLRIDKFIEWNQKVHQTFHNTIEIKPSEITITSLDAQFIEKAIKIVEDNISDGEFTVDNLSDSLAMSRSSLYKKLMAITGNGPADFIRIIRLKRACQLLKQSDIRVSDVAYSVGFNSPKRFTINFKAEYGMTPTEYQQKITDNTTAE
jgi:signal transduction histidine kinase/DNA-binding response OmpR family regulator/ligand-binding sensor domain-containing protein